MRAIQVAQADDLSVALTAKAILDSQTGFVSKRRASTIARTETHTAASFANHEMAKDLNIPQLQKQWVAVNDARTRGAHSAVSGTIIPMDEDFDVVVRGITYKMGYPSDPRGGAANVVNCRCTLIYVTPEDEVIVNEETVVVDKPLPPPIPERTRSSSIDPLVTLANFKVSKRSQIQKDLTSEFETAANDPRYVNTGFTMFRGNIKDFGSAKLSSDFLDETASAISAIKPELDEICDKVGIPRLRGFKTTKAGSVFASMGDGVMNLNPRSFNRYGSRLRNAKLDPTQRQRDLEKLDLDIDNIISEIDANSKRQQELYDQIFSGSLDLETRVKLRAEYVALGKSGKRLFNRKVKLINERSNLKGEVNLETSDWTPSDGLKTRPQHLESYLSDPLDRIRQVLYHEMGHHIHQQYKIKIKKQFENINQRLMNYKMVDAPVDDWLEKSSTYNLLTKGENASKTWSNYGNKNGAEWFAENNSFYWMGKRDKVDPRFITLMDNILEGKDINDESLY
jgi:hypothetical protein